MKRDLTPREKKLTVISAAAFIIYFVTALVIVPLKQSWDNTNALLELTKARYTKALKTAHQAEIQMAAGISETSGENRNTLSALLEDIERSAGSKIIIHRFQPFNNNETTVPGESHKLQVQLDCSGSLQGLTDFFQRMETQNRLTRVRHFYMQPEGKNSDKLQCQLIVVRIVLRDTENDKTIWNENEQKEF